MNLIDRALRQIAPASALRRVQARRALDVLMRYNAASSAPRARGLRPVPGDADTAGAQRARLAAIARDMVRNSPLAARAQSVIAANVVGDGIIPKVEGGTKSQRKRMLDLVRAHLDTTAIDAHGRQNLYGLQRLAINAVVDAGEVLIRRRWRRATDGLPLPVQIEVLEPEHLDATRDGLFPGGILVRDGIQYDAIGRRMGYWLFPDHPQSGGWAFRRQESRLVPASEVLHIFRQDRPNQRRGVSWLAPVALYLQDLDDFQDAQIMRQKIAACFAAFRVMPDFEPDNLTHSEAADPAGFADSIRPGRIQNLAPGEDIRFASPPRVEGYDEFTAGHIRMISAALGITYEALSGDLSSVNFSSARMGRMEMDRNVSTWQWLMMIPQMLQPLGGWIMEAAQLATIGRVEGVSLAWVPPRRMLIDPSREIPAMVDAIRAGLDSRPNAVRALGYDPEGLLEEQIADMQALRAAGLVFDSDAGAVSQSGVRQAVPRGPVPMDEGDE